MASKTFPNPQIPIPWVWVGSARKGGPISQPDPMHSCQTPQDSFNGSEPSPIHCGASMNQTCSNTSEWCCDISLLSQLNKDIVSSVEAHLIQYLVMLNCPLMQGTVPWYTTKTAQEWPRKHYKQLNAWPGLQFPRSQFDQASMGHDGTSPTHGGSTVDWTRLWPIEAFTLLKVSPLSPVGCELGRLWIDLVPALPVDALKFLYCYHEINRHQTQVIWDKSQAGLKSFFLWQVKSSP